MMYLKVQAKLWPTAVNDGVMLKANKAAAQALAQEYKDRFRGSCEPNWNHLTVPKDALALGAAYLRYSCDSSNPRSLAQQLRNCLERAARESIFVPWEAVFADAALSGTTSARPGYQKAKKAVGCKESPLKVLIIDELGRAARDAIESLKLGRLIDSCGKRMIGVTDGFDTNQPQSKMMLHFSAITNESFVEQLRHKVSRGMRDAFERHEVTNSPCFGYSLKVVKDKKGNPIVKPNGKIKKRVEINKKEAAIVREIYDLYSVKMMSPQAIAQHLNDRAAGGKSVWSQVQVSRILKHRPSKLLRISTGRVASQTPLAGETSFNIAASPARSAAVEG